MDVPRDEKKANFLEGAAQQAKFVATSIVSVRTLEKYFFWFLPHVITLIQTSEKRADKMDQIDKTNYKQERMNKKSLLKLQIN